MKDMQAINQVLDMEYWETLQHSIAEVTGMAIVTVDNRGIPVTTHSCCSEFCKMVRNDEMLGQYCQKSDARGGWEGFRTMQPYIYNCHFSIIDIAIPIVVKENYLGAVIAGQIKLDDGNASSELEQVYKHIDQMKIEKKKIELADYYEKLPIFSVEQCDKIMKMLYNTCQYIIKVTMLEDHLEHRKQKALKIKDSSVNDNHISSISEDSVSDKVTSVIKQKNVISNKTIENVIEYIYSNKGEFISLTAMAEYCHISSAYLSRLFTKEVGESYSSFVSGVKIVWAKELLEETDMTIIEISDKLGFNDPSHFIKFFKNSEGVTPAFYRTHFRNVNIVK